jgi:hypothetical protein
VKALNPALKVPTLVAQKLINKKEVRPINSQPNSNTYIFPDKTNKDMLQTKALKKRINLSTLGS